MLQAPLRLAFFLQLGMLVTWKEFLSGVGVVPASCFFSLMPACIISMLLPFGCWTFAICGLQATERRLIQKEREAPSAWGWF